MDSLAITDHGVMYGVIQFYEACHKAGIKPILGCEVYVAPGSRFDKKPGENEQRYNHLILLAENNQGYENLMRIVSIGFTDGYYYKPRVDYEVLEQYHDGLICTSACLAGEVQRYLAQGFYEEGKKAALRFESIFGKGNFFLELQDHGIPAQRMVNQQLVRMSEETGIELIATNDVHYTFAEDADAHDVLLCIQTGKKLQDENRMRYEGGQYYLKSREEMEALFPYAKQALDNTGKIADRCNVEIEFGVTKVPKFDYPPQYANSYEYLRALCLDGLHKRYGEPSKEIMDRFEYEISVISSMGYVDYFLIVWDYVNYAKTHDIPVGPGRGSAAGSIISYCLGITDLDPIKYSLVFERFLNPERVTMPDIDVDFCPDHRQDVIDYVVKKYGQERVSQIVTFGTMAARAVIKDVGRVMDLPFSKVDAVSKMVPMELKMTIPKALKENPKLQQAYDEDEEVRVMIDKCKRLEGLPRHASVHASGVLICDKAIVNYVPLSAGADGAVVAQFDMTTLERLGLLKMDFLGLRNLTVIKNAVELVKKTHPDFNMDEISYTDPGVYEMIGAGKCEGVFQLESAGMKSFMKELKPTNIEDLIAGISLYRPGPMDFIPNYIKGKNNKDSVVYDCPQLEPILKPTYGCIVYQEQVMQIVRDLAGYSWGRSDLVRRAMSKKKASVMEQERKFFIYGNPDENVPGCVANGIDEKVANKIFDEMTDFAQYAFNKSHAACYSLVTYQTAYLKYHYPVEYMAALMTSVVNNTAKVSGYILAARQMNLQLLPPDVNTSEYEFTVEDGKIRFGLSAIKNLGRPTIQAICAERAANGIFKSLQDFLTRMCQDVNKRTVESLIKAGACDAFSTRRRPMVMIYAQMLDEALKKSKDDISGQMSLFDFADESEKESLEIPLPDVPEFTKEELLGFEQEVLGVYVSGHPLDEYAKMWKKHTTAMSTDFEVDEESGTAKAQDGSHVTIGGMITNRTVKTTKTGKLMAFLTIEDLVGSVEVLIFPRDYDKYQKTLEHADKVFITGRVTANAASDGSMENGKLIAESIQDFADVPRILWIKFDNLSKYNEEKADLRKELLESVGHDRVIIYCQEEKQKDVWPMSDSICISSQMIEELRARYGEANVETT